jgi:hypothetical protein
MMLKWGGIVADSTHPTRNVRVALMGSGSTFAIPVYRNIELV